MLHLHQWSLGLFAGSLPRVAKCFSLRPLKFFIFHVNKTSIILELLCYQVWLPAWETVLPSLGYWFCVLTLEKYFKVNDTGPLITTNSSILTNQFNYTRKAYVSHTQILNTKYDINSPDENFCFSLTLEALQVCALCQSSDQWTSWMISSLIVLEKQQVWDAHQSGTQQARMGSYGGYWAED